jgi:hypothetical protein
MAVGSVSFPQPQAYSGGADFTPLANLGNVYQKAQAQQRQLAALAQLGTDPTANAQTLIQSQDPTLVGQGINLQNAQAAQQRQAAEDAERRREFQLNYALSQSREDRANMTETEKYKEKADALRAQGIDPASPYGQQILTGVEDPETKVRIARATAEAKNADKPLSATEERQVTDAENRQIAAQDTIDNIKKMREVSPKAWSGAESYLSGPAQEYLPSAMVPQGAIETEKLKNLALLNVASQAKATFGARLNQKEVELLNKIETTPQMDDKSRQAIYDQVETMMQRHLQMATAQAEGIRNRTYFKPGGGYNAQPAAAGTPDAAPAAAASAAAPAAPAAPAAAPTAKPTLSEFMEKARAANPGAKDSDLAQYWKKKYGG